MHSSFFFGVRILLQEGVVVYFDWLEGQTANVLDSGSAFLSGALITMHKLGGNYFGDGRGGGFLCNEWRL